MATDALTETVLDEAEAIVRAEWIRLQRSPPQADGDLPNKRRAMEVMP